MRPMCEFPVVYHMNPRRARKEHRCCECGGKIAKGETYNYHSGVWDNQGRSFKVCVDCDRLRDELNKDRDFEDWIVFGGLVEDAASLDDLAASTRLVKIMKMRGANIPKYLLPDPEDAPNG